jgi:hypothetical protein
MGVIDAVGTEVNPARIGQRSGFGTQPRLAISLRPPFRVRPRPEGGYEEAASEGMLFNDVPMRDFIGEQFVRQATQSIFKS